MKLTSHLFNIICIVSIIMDLLNVAILVFSFKYIFWDLTK